MEAVDDFRAGADGLDDLRVEVVFERNEVVFLFDQEAAVVQLEELVSGFVARVEELAVVEVVDAFVARDEVQFEDLLFVFVVDHAGDDVLVDEDHEDVREEVEAADFERVEVEAGVDLAVGHELAQVELRDVAARLGVEVDLVSLDYALLFVDHCDVVGELEREVHFVDRTVDVDHVDRSHLLLLDVEGLDQQREVGLGLEGHDVLVRLDVRCSHVLHVRLHGEDRVDRDLQRRWQQLREGA